MKANLVVEKKRKYIVRRLTPLECCRLQGFPDWWEDGVEGSDSARYKMWGNGIALPCAVDVLRRLAKELDAHDQATLREKLPRAYSRVQEDLRALESILGEEG